VTFLRTFLNALEDKLFMDQRTHRKGKFSVDYTDSAKGQLRRRRNRMYGMGKGAHRPKAGPGGQGRMRGRREKKVKARKTREERVNPEGKVMDKSHNER
jgi:hypothetical protein